jgi:predicted DNA-binding protein
MARTQTIVQLSDELLSLLDAAAQRRGSSRSALVREAVAAYLHDEQEAELSRRIVEAYTRVPQAEPDEWGHPGEIGREGALRVMRRLDAEERAAGHEPW